MGLDVFAIVFSLAVLMAVAYRGLPVIVFAPVCALLAAGVARGAPAELRRDVHGGGGRVHPVVLPAVPPRRGLRQADGNERRGGNDCRRDRPVAGASPRDPGSRPGVRGADLWRRVAVRGRI